MTVSLHVGDCRDAMRSMEENSIDSIVTDPPYGLGFMGNGWDHNVPGIEFWTLALKVAKPGAHLLAFGGTKTFHRLMCAIEDSGWEIRDTIMWVYGTGQPKSKTMHLKPAWEPVVLARKPMIGKLEDNLEYCGTGKLNIESCRVGVEQIHSSGEVSHAWRAKEGRTDIPAPKPHTSTGRWPANLIHDGSNDVVDLFPLTGPSSNRPRHNSEYNSIAKGKDNTHITYGHADNGGSAARFFYCAKASRTDRDEGLDDLESVQCGMFEDDNYPMRTGSGNLRNTQRKNFHPTVKPTELMRYLCRLITPVGGTILDPFCGSGSTGKAAALEGFSFVGIDIDPEYVDISRRRIEYTGARVNVS